MGATAALSLIGAASAQAEMVYVTEPTVIDTVPAYDYSASGYNYAYPTTPYVYSAPVVAAPAPGYVITERDYVVRTPRTGYLPNPGYVRPRGRYVARTAPVVVNRPVAEEEIVTTGYSAHNCFIDLAGVERCY
jgi:hypothetical protein